MTGAEVASVGLFGTLAGAAGTAILLEEDRLS
jgi:hypothetical protein